jgi:fructose-1,6-bisphosphatase
MEKYRVIKTIQDDWKTVANVGEILTVFKDHGRLGGIETLLKGRTYVCDVGSLTALNHCIKLEEEGESENIMVDNERYNFEEVLEQLKVSNGDLYFGFEINPNNTFTITKHNQYDDIVVAWGSESTYGKLEHLSEKKKELLKSKIFKKMSAFS